MRWQVSNWITKAIIITTLVGVLCKEARGQEAVLPINNSTINQSTVSTITTQIISTTTSTSQTTSTTTETSQTTSTTTETSQTTSTTTETSQTTSTTTQTSQTNSTTSSTSQNTSTTTQTSQTTSTTTQTSETPSTIISSNKDGRLIQSQKKLASRKKILAIGLGTALSVIVIAILIGLIFCIKRRKDSQKLQPKRSSDTNIDTEPIEMIKSKKNSSPLADSVQEWRLTLMKERPHPSGSSSGSTSVSLHTS